MSELSFCTQLTFQEVVNGIPHGVAVLDTRLCIVEMNTALERLTGYSSQDASGVYGDFIFRSSLGRKGELFRQVLATGEPVVAEGDILTIHRRKIPIRFTISPLSNQEQKRVGLLLVLEDISLQQTSPDGRGGAGKDHILGHSKEMLKVFDLLPVMAQTDASVLITGETGTGKDMIAEAIHKRSKRARHPFIKINCGALPEALLESELFGHVRGAFTGAVKDTPGMFRMAQHGTIFLTEIGDLPLQLQVKLLSVLDDKAFYPVGGTKKIQVDVRVIAATHRALRSQVEAGIFREDLFYRLNVLRLHLPPLRERAGDLRLLFDAFLHELSGQLNKGMTGCDPSVFELLETYGFPGNVRELRNIVEYCVNICQGHKINPECLPAYLFVQPGEDRQQEAMQEPAVARKSNLPPPSPGKKVLDPVTTVGSGWRGIEKEMILDAMKKTGGNRSQAAKILGWGRTTLWRKLTLHGLS